MRCPDDEVLACLIEGAIDDVADRAELLAHVEACESCHAMIAGASAEDDPRRALRAGDTVGRYVVIGLLGAGGMGAVYRAHDRELDRDVAIKVIRSDLAEDPHTLRERLRTEARSLAKVTSPFVVAIYEVGALSEDTSFLAMELVEGPTLRGWLATPRTQREVLEVFAACARGLAAAHDAGVLHRDFKPDNVLVGRDRRPRIGDFGLATTVDRDTTGLAGTLPYLAPEVRAGGPATIASDQWSLCVALAEALLGKRPDPVALGALPARVRAVVARGLATDPARRAPSLHAVAAALEAIVAPRTARWIALVAGLGIAGVVATFAVMRRGDETCALAPIASWSAADRAALHDHFVALRPERGADAARDVLRDTDAWYARWRPAREAACRDRARLACLELQERRVATIVRVFRAADAALVERAPAITATLPDPTACGAMASAPPSPAARALEDRLAEARGLFDVGKFADTAAIAAEVMATAQADGQIAVELHALVLHGYAARDSNRAPRAAEDFRRGIALALEHSDDATLADALIGLADTTVMLGDVAAHEIVVEIAAGAIARAGKDLELLARLARSRCRIAYRRERDLDRGVRDCEEARRLYLALRGPDAPELAHVENNLGMIAYLRGRYEEAAAHFEAFATRTIRHHGADYQNVDTARVNRAETLVRAGQPDAALALYAELERRRPQWISVWDGAGLAYRRKGAFASAREKFAKAIEVAVAERVVIEECAAWIGLAEVVLDEGGDAGAPLASALARCAAIEGTSRVRLELVRSRAAMRAGDPATARAAAANALALVDAARPLPNSPDDQVRAEIVAWQATFR